MSPGGEPERDDTGLPPVDIEIPDDARELDRDVQAYYRELRAQRRAQRRLRLRSNLGRDGVVLPLLACCLILALITGTLLTVFTATSERGLTGVPGSGRSPAAGRSHPASGRTSSPSGAPSGSVSPSTRRGTGSPSARAASAHVSTLNSTLARLPAGNLLLANGGTVPFSVLSGAVLLLIPPGCACAGQVRQLTAASLAARAPTYLVATPPSAAEVLRLQSGLSQPDRGNVLVATDETSALQQMVPVAGLTVLVVGSDGSLSYANRLRAPLPPAAIQPATES